MFVEDEGQFTETSLAIITRSGRLSLPNSSALNGNKLSNKLSCLRSLYGGARS